MARGPSCSDGDLIRAVAGSRSWRGVLRELGLTATSGSAMRSVRRNADRLGLDYGHFTGQRRWTDAQLEAAVSSSASWREVIDALWLAGDSSQVTLRGHAARLNLDVSRLTPPAVVRRDPPLPMEVDLTNLSRAGSLVAAAWFTLCGYVISGPLEPARYDLASLALDHWPHASDADIEDINPFFVIDGDLSYYAIPVSVVGGLHAITLAGYQDFCVGSTRDSELGLLFRGNARRAPRGCASWSNQQP